jgi:hypothetical protein
MAQGVTLKNTRLANSNQSVIMPSGTAAERPDEPFIGAQRFNTTIGSLEVYNGSSWDALAIEGLANVIVDTFTGDGSTTVFGSLTNRVTDETEILVFVGGVFQTPGTDYTSDGSFDITFDSAVPNGIEINVLHNLGSTTVS